MWEHQARVCTYTQGARLHADLADSRKEFRGPSVRERRERLLCLRTFTHTGSLKEERSTTVDSSYSKSTAGSFSLWFYFNIKPYSGYSSTLCLDFLLGPVC